MLALFSPIKCGECLLFVDVTGARYRLMVFSWFSAIESLVTAKFRVMIFEKEGKGL